MFKRANYVCSYAQNDQPTIIGYINKEFLVGGLGFIPNVVDLALNFKIQAHITCIVIANHGEHGVHGDFIF